MPCPSILGADSAPPAKQKYRLAWLFGRSFYMRGLLDHPHKVATCLTKEDVHVDMQYRGDILHAGYVAQHEVKTSLKTQTWRGSNFRPSPQRREMPSRVADVKLSMQSHSRLTCDVLYSSVASLTEALAFESDLQRLTYLQMPLLHELQCGSRHARTLTRSLH